jgi:hypothetical protein
MRWHGWKIAKNELEEYAVSPDGAKMFGVLDLETQMEGCRFSIGIRNSQDKSIRLD